MLAGSGQLRPSKVIDGTDTDVLPQDLWAQGRQVIPPALPESSHIKHMKTGKVFPWIKALADRSDEYTNCDASGNTDPDAWRGTKPIGWTPPEFRPQAAAPQGFREPAPVALDSQSCALAAHLPPTLEGARNADNRDSALPVPVVANVPMGSLLADIQAQIMGRWQPETSDAA